MKRIKLLYLTFIDMRETPASGSAVRPQKMLQAFQELGLQVKLFDGADNNIPKRRLQVKKIRRFLQKYTPDGCYIEPPSGPMFCGADIRLIKYIHKKGIPIVLFYRDAYWKFPDYFMDSNTSFMERVKQWVIKIIQQYQYSVFQKSCDILYFPSQTMADLFSAKRKSLLPPGCFLPGSEKNTGIHDPLEFIFVGGAAGNHGTFLTLEAFAKVNSESIRAKMTYICPKDQWDSLNISVRAEQYRDWLVLKHTFGDADLKKYYERADIALLTAPKTAYRDLSVPVKIYEYISYLKPVLVTDCTETAKVVRDNHCGWVVKADVDSICDKIMELVNHPVEIQKMKSVMQQARSNNLWTVRAETVISDLVDIGNDKK